MHFCLGTTPTVQQNMTFTRVVIDDVNRAIEVRRSGSGKPVNVARVLHTIGEKVTLSIPLGGDTGRFIRDELTSAGITLEHVEIQNATRTCVTVIDRHQSTATELIEEASPLPPHSTTALLDKFAANLRHCKTAILSGKLAPDAGEEFYADCCRAALSRDVPVILDASGVALLRALKYRPFIAKPNRSELASTLGLQIIDDASLRNAMLELIHRGAQWAVITMGKDGAAATNGTQFWKIPAISVEAVSPIGSGDAFSAGLAAAILAGREIPDACRLGAACAAANTLIPGAGFLRLEDVRRLESQAKVESW
jgi:tagatose 6-phosphate kinase